MTIVDNVSLDFLELFVILLIVAICLCNVLTEFYILHRFQYYFLVMSSLLHQVQIVNKTNLFLKAPAGTWNAHPSFQTGEAVLDQVDQVGLVDQGIRVGQEMLQE